MSGSGIVDGKRKLKEFREASPIAIGACPMLFTEPRRNMAPMGNTLLKTYESATWLALIPSCQTDTGLL